MTRRMVRLPLPVAVFALLSLTAPAAGQEACRLCFGSGEAAPGEQPLSIEIHADLSFSRLALGGSGAGSAAIDPQSGTKRTDGGMIDLGGMSVQGRGRITGTPQRAVRIDLPRQVTMSTPDGTSAELTDLVTNLPPFPLLDSAGTLEFTFGGQLNLKGHQGGNFRGRIPISVDYN